MNPALRSAAHEARRWNFAPVETFADLVSLNRDEITAGYMEYRRGDPEPGQNRGRAYWHGWRNAAADRYEIPQDAAMAKLAHEIAPGGRFTEAFRRLVGWP